MIGRVVEVVRVSSVHTVRRVAEVCRVSAELYIGRVAEVGTRRLGISCACRWKSGRVL
jgi:hypothetical protein